MHSVFCAQQMPTERSTHLVLGIEANLTQICSDKFTREKSLPNSLGAEAMSHRWFAITSQAFS